MKRREFLGSAMFAAGPRKPNIIWFMADDMGWGDVGCYGQQHIQTPNVDRMAREGMRFTDAYAGCTVCAPSRSVLMTGLHGGHTPVRSNPGGVPLLESEKTVADVLKAAGYRTGLYGKWGLGDIGTSGVPWKHGFDEFFGFLHQAHAHFQYPDMLYDNGKEVKLGGKVFANDAMHEKSLDFIRRHKDQPFFLYCAATIPHFEPHVPEDSLAPYRGKIPNGPAYKGDNRGRLKPQPELGPAYAGMVSRVDRYLGNILSLLKELRLENDTIVFFTSDNGGIMGKFENDFFRNTGPYRGQKQSMYEGGLRVPMVVRWPGRVKAGTTSTFAWSFCDFLPTAAELAGTSPLPGIDGVSVLPVLQGKKQKDRQNLYWEQPRYVAATGTFRDEAPVQAMRQGKWKAVRPVPDGPVEVYDLSRDPGEKDDLAKSQPELGREWDRRLRAARVTPRPQSEPKHPWWDAKS